MHNFSLFMNETPDPVERADFDRLGLSLQPVRIEYDDYGRLAPIVTADILRSFIAAWQWNDPNGTWDADGVIEADGALIYEDNEGNREVWSIVGMHEGKPVYRLTQFASWHAYEMGE